MGERDEWWFIGPATYIYCEKHRLSCAPSDASQLYVDYYLTMQVHLWRRRKNPLHAPYHFLTWRPAHNQINQHPRGEGFEYCNSIGREKLKWRTYTPNNPIRVSTAIAIMIAFPRKMNEWKIHEHTALDVYTVSYLMSSRCFIRMQLHRWLLLDLRSSFLFPSL